MFRLYGKLYRKSHIIQDTVFALQDEQYTRTKKILRGLSQICMTLDLEQPIWLDKNIKEFKLYKKTNFNQDNFIEKIRFDRLEIEILEE